MSTDEGYISNYLGVNIKKNLDVTFELLQLHLVEIIINHVGIIVSMSLNSRETPAGKPSLHKYVYCLGRMFVWDYSSDGGMLSYLQGSTLS